MPAAVDSCVQSLLAEWKNDPAKRPKHEEGQKPKDQAFAICQAAYNKRVQNALAVMFDEGMGPVLLGAAATNRPFIPKLKETRVIEKEGKEKLLVHLANSGHFYHPFAGPFVLNRQVFSSFIANFDAGVLGQSAAYDCRHRPDAGAFGWFEKLMLGDEIDEGKKEFWGLVDPTEVGLAAINGGQFRYSSMEFHLNYDRSDVTLDLEGVTQDFCLIGPEDLAGPGESEVEVDDMSSDKEVVSLEKYQEARAALEALEAERQQDADAIQEAKERAKEAEALMLEMRREALETSINAVIELAQNTVDDEGNGLPRQLVDWIAKVVRFEAIGEDEKVIRLSDDVEPGIEVRKYLISAMRALVLEMPGTVPAERRSSGGGDDRGDKFDYGTLWEE